MQRETNAWHYQLIGIAGGCFPYSVGGEARFAAVSLRLKRSLCCASLGEWGIVKVCV